MWPVTAPLVMRMRGYTRGVATVTDLPYPAVRSSVMPKELRKQKVFQAEILQSTTYH